MEANEIKKRISELMPKHGAFTPADKRDIKAMIAEAGIDFLFRTKCPNCYADALTLLALHYNVRSGNVGAPTLDGKYICVSRGVFGYNGGTIALDCNTAPDLIARFREICPKQFGKFYVENKATPADGE